MRFAPIVLLIAILVYFPATGGRTARADEPPSGRHTIIAVDLAATRASADDSRVAISIALHAAWVQQAGTVAFLGYSRSALDPDPYQAGSDELAAAARQFAERIGRGSVFDESDQFKVLSTVFQYLSESEAPAGSRLLLITNNGLEDATSSERERLLSFAELFEQEGWVLQVAMLPTARLDSRAYLSKLASAGGGQGYDMGFVAGIAALVGDLYSLAPATAIHTALERGAIALAPIEVPPHSSMLTLSVVRQTPDTLIELFDPRGAPVVDIRADTESIETPVVVLIRVSEPEAGRWTARVLGGGSEVLVDADIQNPMSLQLIEQPPLPVGSPAVIRAAVTIDGAITPLPGAYVNAAVRGPSDEVVVYRLRDDGLGADEKAGDGVFSVTVPAPQAQAISDVDLNLKWDNYGAELRGTGVVQAEKFPSLTILPLQPPSIDHGDSIPVAIIEVRVSEYPLPVRRRDITFNVTQRDGSLVRARLIPKDPISDDRAWQFEAWASPPVSGSYIVSAELATNYLGRDYVTGNTSPPVSVEVIPPPPMVVSITRIVRRTVLWWVWPIVGVAAAAVTALGAAVVIGRRRIEPYGYLYDDRDRLVIDFKNIRLASPRRFFGRDRIRADELPDLPIGDGEFVFKRDRVELRSRREEGPSIRVDGRPAGRMVTLTDGVRLGLAGRLLTFVRGPITMGPAASGAGD